MGLLTPGYFPNTYWGEDYWNDGYWLNYGTTSDKSHTTDSLIKVVSDKSHSTDSLLKTENDKSHVTDSLIKSLIDKSHATDSLIKATSDKSHVTDSLLKETINKSHLTDSLIKAVIDKSHITDSLLKAELDKTHSTDSLIEAVFDKLHATDTYVAYDRLHTTDSLIKIENDKSHVTDSLIKEISDKQHSTDSLIKEISDKSHVTDSLIKAVIDKQHITDALIKTENDKSHTTDSLVKAELDTSHITNTYVAFDKSYTTDSLVKTEFDKSHATDSLIKATSDKSHSTDSLIKIENDKSHLTDSLIKVESDKQHSTDSFIESTGLLGHTTDSFVKSTVLLGHTTDAYVAFDKSHATDSLIKESPPITYITSALCRAQITAVSGQVFQFNSGGGILSQYEITLQAEGMHTFRLNIANDHGQFNNVFRIGCIVEIWLDPEEGTIGATKRLTGFIKKVGYSPGISNMIVLQGMGYLSKFRRIIVHEMYRGPRTYESIITDPVDGLLAQYAPEVSGAGILTTYKSLKSDEELRFDHISLYECLNRIRQVAGDWVFEITPALVLNLRPRGYIDTEKSIEDIPESFMEYDDANLVNQLYFFGGEDLIALSKAGWIGTASLNNIDAPKAYDGNVLIGWDSGVAQMPGDWYNLDLGAVFPLRHLYIDCSAPEYENKYPRNFKVEASYDNTIWDYISEKIGNEQRNIVIDFDQNNYRYLRITLTGIANDSWAIGEIFLYSSRRILTKMASNSSKSTYGLYENKLSDSTVALKSQAKAIVKAELDINKNPRLACDDIALAYFFDCEPNELIQISVAGTPISQKFKVRSVTFSEGTRGSFQERIKVID